MAAAPRRLDDLLAAAGVRGAHVVGDSGALVAGVTHDSRAVAPGDVFCCVAGEHADGHDFAGAALAAGAAALVVERLLAVDAPQVVVGDVRAAMGPLADAVHGHPSRSMTVVGVTGTNGKTTTTHLLAAILRAAGWPTKVLGTLSGARTTPEAPDLQRQLAAWRDTGTRAVAMEASSHALALHRVDGTHFAVAVFTNLSRDHLDFHGTIERYFAAKARLFEPDLCARAVVCLDDVYGRLLADAARVPTTGYSMADAGGVVAGARSGRFTWRGREVTLAMGGTFNVANALAAATTASVLGIPDDVVVAGLASAPPVPGRFEPVDAGQPFAVVVDYAHTPDGIERALAAARAAAGAGRVIVVFGCGGDRDRTKRPAMGAAATAGADLAVLTSDNPRSEDPMAIIAEVRLGAGAGGDLVIEPDRRAAIAYAVRRAGPGDVVLVAGKGHEATQVIGDRALPFDDRVVVAEELGRLGGGSWPAC